MPYGTKTILSLLTLALAAFSHPYKTLENPLGVKYGINPNSMISYESIYFRYAPNYNPKATMATLNTESGQKGATYNVYSQIYPNNVLSISYDGNNQYDVDDIISSGAVLIPSLMPYVEGNSRPLSSAAFPM